MPHRERIDKMIADISSEVLSFIQQEESKFTDCWVPAKHIKESLNLNLPAVPQANEQQGSRGWLFGIIARRLEDTNKIEYRKKENRAYCKSKTNNSK